MNNASHDVRNEAVNVLMLVLEKKGRDSRNLSEAMPPRNQLEPAEYAFLMQITNGTLEHLLTIDEIINKVSSVKVVHLKPVIRCILRTAVYQIYYLNNVKHQVAVNEAVRLTEKHKLNGLKGFVNGVLRGVVRVKGQIQYPDKRRVPDKYLSVKYSMPVWIVQKWTAAYGVEATEKILSGKSDESMISLRVNKSKGDTEQVIEELTNEGIKVVRNPYLDYSVRVSGFSSVSEMGPFAKGTVTAQDLSSTIVGEIADVGPGTKCLDVCAAPGGKTMHLADKGASIIACDRSEGKIKKIYQNMERCGFQDIKAIVRDARDFEPSWEEAFDFVLADLPCSGLGVVGRKYDIRYRISVTQINELSLLQKEILNNAVKYVKKGGCLLYSTCTISRSENEENVRWILNTGLFEPVDLSERLPKAMVEDARKAPGGVSTMRQGYLQIFPGFYPCDGFFISLFRRKA